MPEFAAKDLDQLNRGDAEDYIRRNPDFAAELAASGYAMDKLLSYYLAELLKRIAAHREKKAREAMALADLSNAAPEAPPAPSPPATVSADPPAAPEQPEPPARRRSSRSP